MAYSKNRISIEVALAFSIIIFSCSKGIDEKVIENDKYSITIPADWQELNLRGIDSYVFGIKTKSNDTIFFDYGNNTYKMNEAVNVTNIEKRDTLINLGFDVNEMAFSETPELDKNQGVFHKEYYSYDTINGRVAKIRLPKKAAIGTTGIYFNLGKQGLYVYTKNVDIRTQEKVLESFKTIIIK